MLHGRPAPTGVPEGRGRTRHPLTAAGNAGDGAARPVLQIPLTGRLTEIHSMGLWVVVVVLVVVMVVAVVVVVGVCVH